MVTVRKQIDNQIALPEPEAPQGATPQRLKGPEPEAAGKATTRLGAGSKSWQTPMTSDMK